MWIPALCYHRIETPPVEAHRDTNFVTPDAFAEQVGWLARMGYTGVTVAQILAWQRGTHSLPARPVAITFDDAYDSVVTHALPRLAHHNWPCTVYAVSAYLGDRNRWDPTAPPARLLDAAALRALLHAGHDVGAHTRHHRRVRGLDGPTAHEELAGSREDLEQALGALCESLAFPYGSHDLLTVQRVREAGFAGAVTLKRRTIRRRSDPFRLGRMSVGGPLSLTHFALKFAKLQLTPSLI
ncbi:MAG TPA: polysaccharide deacetylase family protein [Gemmatimonas sp.]|uniref:polysaccharide deacetylase family protein n=1 Tax=Gemmatimonas sp. TaxID=1962908 RepID=UPI002EDA5118